MNNILEFLKKHNIKANNIELFVESFTHSSYANEKRSKRNYQRLEFLGDAVLSKLAAEKIFFTYPKKSEGEMSVIKNYTNKGNVFAKFSKELGFENIILRGKSADTINKNILEDVFEAFVGALYLDQGEEKVKEFLKDNLFKEVKEAGAKNLKNPKTQLQEYLQAESRNVTRYETTKIKEGFLAEVFHDDISFGKGKGSSKKEAEVNAAKNALELMGKGEK